jgi:protease-4
VKTPFGASPQDLLKMALGMGGRGPERGLPDGPTIAVLYAVGPIVKEDPDQVLVGESVINANRMVRLLRKLRERENVKAIVLRIDSPGGSAEASDIIWHALREADKSKPVIASMSDVAGSGGYYIATGARSIYAQQATITGSIGVVGGKFVLKGLFDKLGLSVDVFERGPNAGLFSSVEPFSEAQRERFRALLRETHEMFVDRIVGSREMSREQVMRWADGRSLTGHQAIEAGLVDGIGGLDVAVKAARREAGLPEGAEVAVARLPRSQSLLEVIMWGKDSVQSPHSMLREVLPRQALPALGYLRAMQAMQDHQAAAIMPGLISIE